MWNSHADAEIKRLCHTMGFMSSVQSEAFWILSSYVACNMHVMQWSWSVQWHITFLCASMSFLCTSIIIIIIPSGQNHDAIEISCIRRHNWLTCDSLPEVTWSSFCYVALLAVWQGHLVPGHPASHSHCQPRVCAESQRCPSTGTEGLQGNPHIPCGYLMENSGQVSVFHYFSWQHLLAYADQYHTIACTCSFL